MNKLLLELYSEEIPNSSQIFLEEFFGIKIKNLFEKNKITYHNCDIYSLPTRISIIIDKLELEENSKSNIIKGPSSDSNEIAIEKFCLKYNKNKDELIVKEINSKNYFFIELKKENNNLIDIIPKLLQELIESITWPKSMKWGDYEIEWIRPLKNILCLYNNQIVDFNYFHLKANSFSFGHKFLKYNKILINNIDDYNSVLEDNFVITSRIKRKLIIENEINKLENKYNITIEKDIGLLNEIIGLVEYPVILIGKIPSEFLTLPHEILKETIKTHQKYFVTKDEKNITAPYFIFVSNIVNNDEEIIRGNEKVLKARLQDALFFYNADCNIDINNSLIELKNLVFHDKLGSVYDKTQRLISLSQKIFSNYPILIEASKYSKIDLVSQLVSEFPKLQGIIASFIIDNQLNNYNLSSIIKEHYLPQGLNSEMPTKIESKLLSLLDKIDSLVGFFVANEKISSSKDPLGIRRLTLGILRLLSNIDFEIDINNILDESIEIFKNQLTINNNVKLTILNFIEERLKIFLKNNFNIEIIEFVLNLNKLPFIKKTISYIDKAQKLYDSGALNNIISCFKRIDNLDLNNINANKIDSEFIQTTKEKDFFQLIFNYENKITNKNLDIEDYLNDLNMLSSEVESFFSNHMINDENPNIANNRKLICSKIYKLFDKLNFKKLL